MPNKKMMENHVDNLTTRQLRRVRLSLGLSFNTTTDQLRKIIEEIKEELQKRNIVSRNGSSFAFPVREIKMENISSRPIKEA